MEPFRVTMYHEGDIVVQGLPVAFLPRPGVLIIVGADLWEIMSEPQVYLGDQDMSFRAGAPVSVQVIVRPGVGIHPDDPGADPAARYELARTRYANAVQDYPRIKALAARLLAQADQEFQDAEAALNEFEEKPGVARPEFRGRM